MKLKKLKNNKSGFTLLEIIIVVIIVGVLASLALPRFFSTIEFSRSTEALNAIGVIRKSVERCGLAADDVTGCGDGGFNEIDVEDPGLEAGAHFTYQVTINNGPNRQYDIMASRNGGLGTITVSVDGAGGTITRSGTGAYASIK